jgi:hypothetical protein
MSKLFKILISLMVICLSCTALFACYGGGGDDSDGASESQMQSITESEQEIQSEESEEDTESNFEVKLPEVDRM